MARPRTWITVAAALVLLAIVALLLAPRLLGEARLRAEVERRLSAALGRDVTVRGPVRLSTGAWLEVDLGDVTISGDSGPAATKSVPPLATIGRLRASVETASLLSGPIAIGRVQIEGATFHLHVDERGRGSWEGLGAAQPDPGAPTDAGAAARAWTLAGLDVERSALRYTDARSGADYGIADWQAAIGRIALPAPFDVQTNFRARSGDAPAGSARVAVRVTADPETQRYGVERLTIDGAFVRRAKALPAKLAIAGATYDGRAGTASLRELQAETLGIRIRADGTATNLTAQPRVDGAAGNLAAQPRVDGTFATDAFEPRAVLAALDVTLPPMQGPDALARAQAKGRITGNSGVYAIESLDATLDRTRLTGRATHAANARWTFDLAADRLDVDPYLKPPKLRDRSPVLLPTELLRSLDVAGTLRVGELLASGVRLKNVTIDLDGSGGGSGGGAGTTASRTAPRRDANAAKAR
jgi:AsmA protein